MFNRGTFNSFKYNSVPATIPVPPDAPIVQVGGNFQKKRRIIPRQVELVIDVRAKILKNISLFVKAEGIMLNRANIMLSLQSTVSSHISYARLVKSSKIFDVKAHNTVKSTVLVPSNKSIIVNSSILASFSKEYIFSGISLTNKEYSISSLAIKQYSSLTDIILSAHKQQKFEQSLSLTAKKDIENLLIFALMDI